MSDPIVFQAGGCPICGGDVMAEESMEGGSFTDGEYAFCASNCGWFGSVSVVEDDGEAFPSTASELEPIIERLEEAKDQAGNLASLLREARVMVEETTIRMPRWTSPQYGPQDPLGAHSLLVRIDAALQEASAPRQASNASDHRADAQGESK